MNERNLDRANPATIALPVAEDLMITGQLDEFRHTDYEIEQIAELQQKAHDLDLIDKTYFVESGRSILMPVKPRPNEDIKTIYFPSLSFEGQFSTYSTVRLQSALGKNTMRALCLTFDDVTLFPYFDTIPADKQLHVPAFAVQDMDVREK